MRKFFYLLLAVCLPVLFPTSLYAWDMCETSVETLDLAGEVTFTSSFCNCIDGMGQTNQSTNRNATERKVKRVRQSGSPEPDKTRMSLEEALTKSAVARVLFL